MSTLLLATRNPAKLAELRRLLDGVEVLGLADVPEFPEAPETGATFAENALAKARDASAATGLPAIADDSGLRVDALNGMPGVLSARWCGKHGDDVVAGRHWRPRASGPSLTLSADLAFLTGQQPRLQIMERFAVGDIRQRTRL